MEHSAIVCIIGTITADSGIGNVWLQMFLPAKLPPIKSMWRCKGEKRMGMLQCATWAFFWIILACLRHFTWDLIPLPLNLKVLRSADSPRLEMCHHLSGTVWVIYKYTRKSLSRQAYLVPVLLFLLWNAILLCLDRFVCLSRKGLTMHKDVTRGTP